MAVLHHDSLIIVLHALTLSIAKSSIMLNFMAENNHKILTIISISFLISWSLIPQSVTMVREKKIKILVNFFFVTYNSIQHDKASGYIFYNLNYVLA